MSATRTGTSSVVVAGSYFHTGRSGAVLTSASTITITDSFHEVSGSTTINTINGGLPGMGVFLYRPTGASWALGTSGNIEAGAATLAERVVLLVTPDGSTWYGAADSTSVVSANTDISVASSGGVYTLTFNPANVTLDEFTGPLAISKGGSGQTTATAAFDALAPTTTQGDLIYHNGTDNVRFAKGTGKQLLRMNTGATAPEWTTLFDKSNHPTMDYCYLSRNAVQSIPTGVGTAISWNTENSDTFGMHDNGVNPTRVTIQSDGLYLVAGNVTYAANATGERCAIIYWNGSQAGITYSANTGAGSWASSSIVLLLSLGATNYLELLAYQTSGGNLDAGAYSLTTLTVARIS